MNNKIQIELIVVILILLGLGAAIYKHLVLGFPIFPEDKKTVWVVEAKIDFVPKKDEPVEVSLNLPDDHEYFELKDFKEISPGYRFSIDTHEGVRRAVWKSSGLKGKQAIYYQATLYRTDEKKKETVLEFNKGSETVSEGFLKAAVKNVLKSIPLKGRLPAQISIDLLRVLNDSRNKSSVLLLNNAEKFGGKTKLSAFLLGKAGIKVNSVNALLLEDKKRNKKLYSYLEIFQQGEWLIVNPRTAMVEKKENILIWQRNDESVLEIVGGYNGQVHFSTLSSKFLAKNVAVEEGHRSRAMLVDFSIYSLPVADQNTFKFILLIPMGALIISVLRNLVGVPTLGTFMPILIAMVFIHTSLLIGLGLFLLVVTLGLILRYYLSYLNLLLVPRISAVLVFVIIIYLMISVLSIKLGFEKGLQVTFFPMIIISWTIERMSILWEEEGPRDVFIQGGGSLLSASLVYMVMNNPYIEHLTFSFPELLLVVLALILMVGSYTGYRLTELRRFQPMCENN